MRFAATKEQDEAPPEYQGNPKTHGLKEPRGGGFNIMQHLQDDLVKEQKKKRKKKSFLSAVKEAMYWCGPDRTYKMTQREQDGGDVVCPKCKQMMDNERFTRSERMFRCPGCGFKVPTGKVVKKKIEIEIEPDGNVEVEVTEAADGRN